MDPSGEYRPQHVCVCVRAQCMANRPFVVLYTELGCFPTKDKMKITDSTTLYIILLYKIAWMDQLQQRVPSGVGRYFLAG